MNTLYIKVNLLVRLLVFRRLIGPLVSHISLKGGKLNFHSPIGALVHYIFIYDEQVLRLEHDAIEKAWKRKRMRREIMELLPHLKINYKYQPYDPTYVCQTDGSEKKGLRSYRIMNCEISTQGLLYDNFAKLDHVYYCAYKTGI